MIPDIDHTAGNETDGSPTGGGFFGAQFSLERYPFYLMAHVDFRYTIGMEAALGHHKFTRPKWRVLASLSMQDGLSIGEMAEITLFKLSTLSRVVERMESDGLVKRRQRPSDQRITEVHITDAGHEAFQEILAVSRRQYARATEGLSTEEVEQLCATLQKMLHNLQQSPYA
jgi:DNA-binding MarR family transcriptional regulator